MIILISVFDIVKLDIKYNVAKRNSETYKNEIYSLINQKAESTHGNYNKLHNYSFTNKIVKYTNEIKRIEGK